MANGVDPNGAGPLVIPSSGVGSVTASQITDATASGRSVLTGTPAQGRTAMGVYSVAEVDALIAAISTGGVMTAGHSYDRPAAASVDAGTRYYSIEDRQVYVSTGDATLGWDVELPTRLGPDKAGLTSNGSYALASAAVGGTVYAVGAVTIAVLFDWITSPASGQYAGVFSIGTGSGAYEIVVQNVGGNDTIAVYNRGAGTPQTNLYAFVGAMPAGRHRIAAKLIDVAGTKTWRWSFDGSAVADQAVASTVVTPVASSSVGFGCTSIGAPALDGGRSIAAMIWNAALSDADIDALATPPSTETYLLAESASTGAAAISVEARRYDPSFPLVLPARGLTVPLAVGAAVRSYAY